jgi:hypothetical protein
MKENSLIFEKKTHFYFPTHEGERKQFNFGKVF